MLPSVVVTDQLDRTLHVRPPSLVAGTPWSSPPAPAVRAQTASPPVAPRAEAVRSGPTVDLAHGVGTVVHVAPPSCVRRSAGRLGSVGGQPPATPQPSRGSG